jgi:hypothetical protein
MSLGIERISGSAKAIWTLLTVAVSIVTAIGSTAIYVHDLISRVNALETQVNTISQQLKQVSVGKMGPDDVFNGGGTQKCDPGNFMVGIRIGIGPNSNPHGSLVCAKVQPALD